VWRGVPRAPNSDAEIDVTDCYSLRESVNPEHAHRDGARACERYLKSLLSRLIALATKNDLAAAVCDLTKMRYGSRRNFESALVVDLGHRAIDRPGEICRMLPPVLPRRNFSAAIDLRDFI